MITEYKDILLVKVPNDALDYSIGEWNGNIYLNYYWAGTNAILLPKADGYHIIELASKMTFKDWLTEIEPLPTVKDRWPNHYADYPIWFDTPTTSGLSLIKSKGMEPETTLIVKKQTP